MRTTNRVPYSALGPPRAALRPNPLSWVLDHEARLGYLLVAPVVLLLLVLVAWPFVMAVGFALTDRTLGNPGKFVGLDNIVNIWQNRIYQQTLRNTLIFTAGATVLKLIIGFGVALLINERFRFRRLVRSAILLPWIVPTVLSGMAWLWLFTPNFSVLNWIIAQLGWSQTGVKWLTDPNMALFCVTLVNAWRAVPFFAITLLAGLQTIPAELYEAASIDGANRWFRFQHITVPLVMPILLVTLVLSIIWTFSDFQVVYSLTQGGPMNSTHVLATLSYQIGMATGKVGEGAAISLTMLPLLLLLIVYQIWQLRRSGAV